MLSLLARGFDPRGRLSRRAYVRSLLVLMLVAALLFSLSVPLAAAGWRGAAFAGLAGIGLAGLSGLTQLARRLHDRGRTAWWVLAVLVLAALSFVPVEDQADRHPVPVVLYTGVTVVLALWLMIETLGRSGTTGPNRYGGPPTD